MNVPHPEDFIDIHTHGARVTSGIFQVENLMAHEKILPHHNNAMTFTAGIHPWYLTTDNQRELMNFILDAAGDPDVAAIGEAGFDRLRGPSMELQRKIFEEQAIVAKEKEKPLVIHCVRAWDELLAAHKRIRPSVPWMVHGFRGKKELASQLLSGGMYLSFWFDFIVRPESAELLRSLPADRIFLETDGADVSIRLIYEKAANDLSVTVDKLKSMIYNNFKRLYVNKPR